MIRKKISSGITAGGLALALLLPQTGVATNSVEDYLDLPLEDLLSIKVTSVSRKKQQLNEVASAVYVITRDDIRRSGVTSIPEALRMAPGIQVSRIDANKWAIASRGFASQFTNKLLVLIDGRTVYSPSYSGVYWDVQDTLLGDIERIEVIRGPGATVWGSNAVNGVINIITRNAADTRGGLVEAGVGKEERGLAALRYGGEIAQGISGRAYLKYNAWDESYNPETGEGAGDDWRSLRAGFRVDGTHDATNSWTLQGDIYDNRENQLLNLWKDPTDPANAPYAPYYRVTNVATTTDATGWNLLGRWKHSLSSSNNLSLQAYFDRTERQEYIFGQAHDTFDIDFQHQFALGKRHDIIWGLGYRRIEDRFKTTFMAAFRPDRLTLDLYSAFVQDEILIGDKLRLTLGSKFEHNENTGLEIQPSARIVWLPNERMTLWGAVSRAARTPSRVETSAYIISTIAPVPITSPTVMRVLGNPDFLSESLIAYETGWRFEVREGLSLDLALFYNQYTDLQTFEAIDPSNPLSNSTFGNKMQADSHGFELATDWRATPWWRLVATYSYLKISANLAGDSSDVTGTEKVAEGSSPVDQYSLRSMMDLGRHVNLDFWIYHMGDLPRTSFFYQNRSIKDFTSLNIRLAWRPVKTLELSLTGNNLLDSQHAEFVGENLYAQTEIERSVHALLRWEFNSH